MSKSILKPHHEAWLAAHPRRDVRWLSNRLEDGFDVHHLDGNHSNNDPSNLVLIDGDDHLRMHADGKTLLNSLRGAWWLDEDERRRRNALARAAYDMAAESPIGSLSWDEITHNVGWPYGRDALYMAVTKVAAIEGLKWPIWDRREFLRARHKIKKAFAVALDHD